MLKTDNQILVTGASKGIGRAITDKLCASGYSVTGIARNFSEQQTKLPGFKPYTIDLGDLDKLPASLEKIKNTGFSPSVLILNAGMGLFGSLEEYSYQQINSLMNVNFTSHAYITRFFLPIMKRAGRGTIIFIGSDAGLSGSKRGTIYCASKFALRGFAQALRAECAKSGIGITIINPGMIKTDFYNDLDFEPGKAEENSINIEAILDCIELILASEDRTVIDEINLSPLKHVIHFKNK
ncbi:MAG: SDR family oxidoreductase [Acidiferrobacterales bacterium]